MVMGSKKVRIILLSLLLLPLLSLHSLLALSSSFSPSSYYFARTEQARNKLNSNLINIVLTLFTPQPFTSPTES